MKTAYQIILAGFGGQGILFAGKLLAYAAMLEDRQLSWLPSYGPEMRGGTANCHVIISGEPIGSPIVTTPDALIVMNTPSLEKFENAVRPGGTVILDSTLITRPITRTDIEPVCVPATEIAEKLGKKNLANMVMLGAFLKKTGLFPMESFGESVKKMLGEEKQALAEANITALRAGFIS